jgi:phage shock protein PspC (stress-responsive transcriptional regulator)
MSELRPNPAGGPPRKLHLDKHNAKIAGVCSGLANYFGIDPLIVRLVFGIGAIAGFGSFILIYLALWAVVE